MAGEPFEGGSLLCVPVAMGFSKYQSHLSNLDKLKF